MAMTVRRDRQCNAPSLARSRSDLLGPVAVRVGDYFHHVTVGVVEIEAAIGRPATQDLSNVGLPMPTVPSTYDRTPNLSCCQGNYR